MTQAEERALEGYRGLSESDKEALVLFLMDMLEGASPGFLEALPALLDALREPPITRGGKIVMFPGQTAKQNT